MRKRVERETLAADKDEDGRLFVYLDTEETRRTTVRDTSHDTSHDRPPADHDKLVVVLREQLAEEHEAHREARRIIAMLVSRVPELEAPASAPLEATGAPETASEGASRGDAPQPQEGSQRRSWWRSFFGLE